MLYLWQPNFMFENDMPLCIFANYEHLRKTLLFLESRVLLKFSVFPFFHKSAKYAPYEKDTGTSFPSSSRYGSFINDISCALQKLRAKTARQTICRGT